MSPEKPAPRTRRPRRKKGTSPKAEIKRQKILDSAAKLFSQNGYAETKLSDIAEEAGTHAGSLYYHFRSKEDLVQDVLGMTMSLLSNAVMAKVNALPASASASERIVAGIHAHVLHILQRGFYTQAYLKIIDQVPAHVQRAYVMAPRGYGNYWRGILEGARQAGELRTDLNPTVLRLLLLGSITWILEWYKPDGALSPNDIADEVTSLFFDGARKR